MSQSLRLLSFDSCSCIDTAAGDDHSPTSLVVVRLSILASVLALFSGALLVSALPTNTSISTTSPSSPDVISLDVDLEKRTGYRKGSWQNKKGQWGKWGESSENKHCTSNAKQTCYNKGKSCSSKCVCVPKKPPTSTKRKSKRDASYRDNLCAAGQTACRVDSGGLTGFEGRFECLDLRSNIE